MIKKVIFDLRIFMLFYFILVIMFSTILGILQLGNFEEISTDSGDHKKKSKKRTDLPNYEYKNLPYFFQHIITVTRISLGDFDFEAAILLDPFENIIFWFVWF